MKKGLVKTSGILTIIFSIIFIVFGFLFVSNAFNLSFVQNLISNGILSIVYQVAVVIFIMPIIYLLNSFNLAIDSIGLIVNIVFAAFSLIMLFWGIKEISISHKEDESFKKCKKTCVFANIIKFMVFAYFLAILIASFIDNGLKLIFDGVSEFVGVNMIVQVIIIVLAVISFIVFLSPVINYNAKVKNEFKQEENQENLEEVPAEETSRQDFGDGYQDQYYNYAKTEPIDPYALVRSGQAQEGEMFRIVPGRDGVPANITQKGLEDLARLERLRASGAIDDKTYSALKHKICSTNLS